MELISPETGLTIKVTIKDRIRAFCPECDQITDQLGVVAEKTLYYTVCKNCNSVR